MRLGLLVTLLRRESRGQLGRLGIFCASLAVGVAAVVTVSGLSAALDGAVRASARELLAADVAVESRRALPAELDGVLARHPGLRRVNVTELTSLVAVPPAADGTPGSSRLVEVKAVEDGFPFYGSLQLDPPRPLSELLGDDGVVCAPELLASLGLARGDRLRLGGRDFTITGSVLAEPDKLGISFTLGPRVFVSHAALQATELLGFGSTARHRALLALPEGASARDGNALADELAAAFPRHSGARVQTSADAQPSLRRGLQRVDGFLGLVALLSLLIGGIGVAQTVRAWLAGRLQSLAVARCLGVRPRELLLVHFLQTLVLGLIGSLAGVALGVLALSAVPPLVGEWLPADALSAWQPAAMGRGLALGLFVSLFASMPGLLAILRVPPLAALRRDAVLRAAGRPARLALTLLLLGGVFGAAWWQSREVVHAAVFAGGLAAVAGLLLLAARGAMAGVSRLPRARWPLALRHGLSAIGRPDAGTWGGVLALGMGVLVIVAMQLVQSRLSSELSGALPREAPTAFLIDIQKEQWPGVSALLEEAGATHVESTPVITARLASIDGREVAGRSPRGRARDASRDDASADASADTRDSARDEAGDDARDDAGDAGDGGDGAREPRDGDRSGPRRGGWASSREQRLTTMAELPEDNRILEGALWCRPGVDEVSLEQGYAEELGVTLGSVLVFDVLGTPVTLTVSSLRHVEWRTFGINFFLVVEPGVLDGAPQMIVAAAKLPAGNEQRAQDALTARFPNVTLLPVAEIVAKVGALLERLGAGVRVLGLFTVASGLAILAGALGAAAVARRGQIALLKTLGLTRRGVLALFGVEWALLGALAGAVGGAAGALLAWAVLTQLMELDSQLAPLLEALPLAVAGAALLAVVAGAVASLRALAVSPLVVLRQES